MNRLAFINEKGGTGKTTLAVNMAAYLALHRGLRVLAMDLDTQGHASKCLGVPGAGVPYSSYELLMDPSLDWKRAVVPSPRIKGLDLVVGDKRLARLAGELTLRAEDCARLHHVVAAIGRSRRYDVVIMDSPPAMGPVSQNVMVAASDVVVPVQLAYLALEGCADLVATIEQVRSLHPAANPRLGLVVGTFYRRTSLADEIIGSLQEHFGVRFAETIVRYNVRIDEAQSHGQTIFEYDPASPGASMLKHLGDELADKVLGLRRAVASTDPATNKEQ